MNGKISKNVYEEIKKEYLAKNCLLSVIYRKYHRTHNIDKIKFNKIIEKIRLEENIPLRFEKKVKRTNNPFSFHDKHPESYQLADMIS